MRSRFLSRDSALESTITHRNGERIIYSANLTDTLKTQRSGHQFANMRTLSAGLITIYNRIDSEERSQSKIGIRDRTLVDLY